MTFVSNSRLTAPAIVHKLNRLTWGKDWTLEQWNQVLWSDESIYEVFGKKRRKFVRHRSGERMSKNCITQTIKHGGGNVVVWVASAVVQLDPS